MGHCNFLFKSYWISNSLYLLNILVLLVEPLSSLNLIFFHKYFWQPSGLRVEWVGFKNWGVEIDLVISFNCLVVFSVWRIYFFTQMWFETFSYIGFDYNFSSNRIYYFKHTLLCHEMWMLLLLIWSMQLLSSCNEIQGAWISGHDITIPSISINYTILERHHRVADAVNEVFMLLFWWPSIKHVLLSCVIHWSMWSVIWPIFVQSHPWWVYISCMGVLCKWN